jgi:hypothetical protein
MIAAKKLYPQAELVFSGSQERNLREFFLKSSSYAYGFKRIQRRPQRLAAASGTGGADRPVRDGRSAAVRGGGQDTCSG